MNQEERILEFNKIKQLWQEYALTQKAKQMIEETSPFLSELELTAKLRETTESRQLLEKCGNPPLVSLNGMDEILMIASKGDCLAPYQLEIVRTSLTAVRRMRDYLGRGRGKKDSLYPDGTGGYLCGGDTGEYPYYGEVGLCIFEGKVKFAL